MPGPPSLISASALSGSNSRNYHPVVVSALTDYGDSWGLFVFVCRSFSSQSDPVAYLQSLEVEERDMLLPLPCHSNEQLNTPQAFGAPLRCDNYVSLKPTWLIVRVVKVNMGNQAVSIQVVYLASYSRVEKR